MKKKLLWVGLALVLSIFTLLEVFRSGGLSASVFFSSVKGASVKWICLGVVCSFLYILFEGEAIRVILKEVGSPVNAYRGFLYSASDIFFSAITPSATGGQPASAFFMIKDGIPGTLVTVTLLLNVSLYTLAIITLGFSVLIAFPSCFLMFPGACKTAIVYGIVIMTVLLIIIVSMLGNGRAILGLGRLIARGLNWLNMHSIAEKLERKLCNGIEEYNRCIAIIRSRKAMVFRAYLLNLFQRCFQIMVSVCIYMSLHGDPSKMLSIFVIQTFVVLGSNFIPIPGAIGISEFLMLSGYGLVMSKDMISSFTILCRGISFYVCLAISIVTVLFGYILLKYKTRLVSQ